MRNHDVLCYGQQLRPHAPHAERGELEARGYRIERYFSEHCGTLASAAVPGTVRLQVLLSLQGRICLFSQQT